MSNKLKAGMILKIVTVLGMSAVIGWSGWTAYQAYLKTGKPNPDLVDTFRTVFQTDQVQKAAAILRRKEEALRNIPEPVTESEAVIEPEIIIQE